MAGQGFAPKDPEQRAGRGVPKRGEWIDLPPRRRGPIPKGGRWSARTMQAWRAWWRDPASTQWSDADKEAVWTLAELLEDGLVKHAAEIRLRTDGLGLSQKGKRDLRWRVADSAEVVTAASEPVTRFAGLVLVDDDAVSA